MSVTDGNDGVAPIPQSDADHAQLLLNLLRMRVAFNDADWRAIERWAEKVLRRKP